MFRPTKVWSAQMEFHHLGFATESVERELDFFQSLGYRQESPEFTDIAQGVRGIFLVGGGPRIELLENLCGADTLKPWLERRTPLYHIAFLVDDIDEVTANAEADGAIVTIQPTQSVAFSGRRISFVLLKNHLMVEFVES